MGIINIRALGYRGLMLCSNAHSNLSSNPRTFPELFHSDRSFSTNDHENNKIKIFMVHLNNFLRRFCLTSSCRSIPEVINEENMEVFDLQ